MLYLPTSVGLRYGHHATPHSAFLGRSGSASLRSAVASRFQSGSACAPPDRSSISTATRYVPHDARWLHHDVMGPDYQPALHRLRSFPLPRLRPAYPAADGPCGGTLRLSVCGVRTRNTLLIPAFALPASPRVLAIALRPNGNAPLPRVSMTHIHTFGTSLQPRYIVGAGALDQ